MSTSAVCEECYITVLQENITLDDEEGSVMRIRQNLMVRMLYDTK
jgi:hypothetical protein